MLQYYSHAFNSYAILPKTQNVIAQSPLSDYNEIYRLKFILDFIIVFDVVRTMLIHIKFTINNNVIM